MRNLLLPVRIVCQVCYCIARLSPSLILPFCFCLSHEHPEHLCTWGEPPRDSCDTVLLPQLTPLLHVSPLHPRGCLLSSVASLASFSFLCGPSLVLLARMGQVAFNLRCHCVSAPPFIHPSEVRSHEVTLSTPRLRMPSTRPSPGPFPLGVPDTTCFA